MNPLEWVGQQAENAWNAVTGAAAGLWHKVVSLVHTIVHGAVGWILGIFGWVGWAWGHLVEGAEALWQGITELVSEVAGWVIDFVTHTLPEIWHKIEHAAKAAWNWVENAVKWAAKHIAHLAVEAWDWVENALKWVRDHVLRPLEHLLAYVWDHLTRWALFAWHLLTHPLKLAEIVFWPLFKFFEHVAWDVAKKIGEWLALIVLHSMVKIVHLVESIIADVL